MSKTTTPSPSKTVAGIDLRDAGLAAFLAWLWPGAGHFYQRRWAKGALFMICIAGTFFYGLFLGEGRVVYASWKPQDRRLSYLCQLPAGLPALPALVQAHLVNRGKEPLFGDRRWYVAPAVEPDPRQRNFGQDPPTELDGVHKRLHRFFELGTVFTMIAGLLNILAIYDAWGGPAHLQVGPNGKSPPGAVPPGQPKALSTTT